MTAPNVVAGDFGKGFLVPTNPEWIEGFPVRYDNEFRKLAAARGVFKRYIVIGPRYFAMDARAATATLYHEAFHCIDRHKQKRIVIAIAAFFLRMVNPNAAFRWIRRVAHDQEYACDRFAKRRGYGLDLARALTTFPEGRRVEDRMYHPPLRERVARLQMGEDR